MGERDGKEAGGGGDYGRGGVEVVLALALRKCGASGVDVDVVSCSVSPFRVSHSCSACVWAREGAREFVCSCSLKRDWLVGRIALVDRVSERACTCEREKQRLSDYPALLSFAGSWDDRKGGVRNPGKYFFFTWTPAVAPQTASGEDEQYLRHFSTPVRAADLGSTGSFSLYAMSV